MIIALGHGPAAAGLAVTEACSCGLYNSKHSMFSSLAGCMNKSLDGGEYRTEQNDTVFFFISRFTVFSGGA